MVVNLAVHRKRSSGFRIQQGLGAARNIHNGQSFMGQDGAFVLEHSGPIGSAVPLPFRNGEGCCSELICGSVRIEDGSN